jgi:beta-lactamase class A
MHQSEPAGWFWSAGANAYVYRHHVGHRRANSSRRYWRWLQMAVAAVLVFTAAAAINAVVSGDDSRALASAAPPPVVIVPSGTVAAPPQPSQSQRLQDLLNSWTAAHPAQQWGISVQQLSGGQASAGYQADKQFYPASLYKLLLLQSLFNKATFSSWNQSISTGGGKMTLSDCVDRMLRLSDNNCGTAVGKFVGWKTATTQLKAMGLAGTDLSLPDPKLHTTAGDVSSYLNQFYQTLAGTQSGQFAGSSMARQIYRGGIQSGSPGCSVSDKVGDLNGYRHDAAIVSCGDISYILVIMSKGGSYAQIADLATQVNAIFTAG